MSKIIYINPPISMEERLGKISNAGNNMPFLGLLYLFSATREKNYKGRIIDCPAENLNANDTIDILTKENPDYVGLTASTISIYSAADMAARIKNRLPKTRIIIGGPHISALPQKTFKMFEEFDYGVIGEGEITIVELLDAIENNSDMNKVKGIIYRNGKETNLTPYREMVKNLDDLPQPAYDQIDVKKYSSIAYSINDVPVSSIITSRGCPFSCAFCDRTVFGNKVRRHSNEYVMEMLDYLVNHLGIQELYIYDDMFSVFRDKLIEFCELLMKKNWKLKWTCNVRVDSVDEEMLKFMKDSGCFQVSFGIESGSKKIINSIKKKIDLDKAREKIEMAYNAGLRVKAYFIMGFPDETEETIIETRKYVKTLKITEFQLTFLTPFPGSPIYEIAKSKGNFEDDWKKMSYMHCVYTPPHMTKKELEDHINKTRLMFYMNPIIIINYIRLIKSFKDFKKFIKVSFAFIKSIL